MFKLGVFMRYWISSIALIVFVSHSLQAKILETSSDTLASDSVMVHSDTLINLATSLVGVPYRYGGITPEEGFDCSGFVKYVYSNFGYDIPRTTVDIANYGEEVHVDSCKKGDIILFSGRDKKKRPVGHAGIVISDMNEPLEFIHSATSRNRGVVITAYDALDYYKERFVKVIRVLTP